MEAVPQLHEILARLPPAEAEVVRRHLAVPAWQLRAERLAARDDAIREARRFFADMRPSRAAEEMARALDRYIASGWRDEQRMPELPAGADERRETMHRIARLNGGEGLGWRQIYNVWNGSRGS